MAPEVVTSGKEAMETGFALSQIDTTTPHPARMYDALLGGKDNYAADRQAVRQVLKAAPEVRDSVRADRAFLQRVVRFLAGEAGIRQIVDVGTGIPAAGNAHEAAAQVAPRTRVAYVDNDPIVTTHARALLTGTDPVAVIDADLRDPARLLTAARQVLDFSQPVAVLLVAVLHFIRDSEQPDQIVTALKDAMAPGSYLVISHGTADFNPERAQAAVRFYEQATAPFVLRTRQHVTRFFDGLELIEPGLVQLPQWRPDGPHTTDPANIWLYAGVARKN